jgi:hypothetical protein
MKAVFSTSVLCGAILGSLSWAADVAYDKNFVVKSTPTVWSKDSQLCFAIENKATECAKVTAMGEIKLREDGGTSTDVFKTYNSKLGESDQKIIESYRTFYVRYLALNGETDGRYIVQVFMNVGPGTQALYIFGNYKLASSGAMSFEPVGYGEASSANLSFLRSTGRDDEVIDIASQIVEIWAKQYNDSLKVESKP